MVMAIPNPNINSEIPSNASRAGKGSIDIYMEVWADNYKDTWEKLLADGSIIKLGTNYPDAPQGWYVPTYMIKGDTERGIEPVAPDLKSVNDLPKYWDLFKDREVPGKGRFHNSPPGWAVTDINAAKIKTMDWARHLMSLVQVQMLRWLHPW